MADDILEVEIVDPKKPEPLVKAKKENKTFLQRIKAAIFVSNPKDIKKPYNH